MSMYHWSTSNKDESSGVNVCLHVCSHQRLLFKLLDHSDDLDKDTMSDVSKDIVSEELATSIKRFRLSNVAHTSQVVISTDS